jgi:2-polyprenyl-3-methyl-5-hydroxy-6-metoxy-1,4-benzoquinol methylase
MYQNPSPLIRWYFYNRLDGAIRLAQPTPESTVLDVGCWMGYFLASLAQTGARVIGIDNSVEICKPPTWDPRVEGWTCLQIARELLLTEFGSMGRVQLIEASGDRMPLQDESVDTVFALDVLEHIFDSGPVIDECFRVLKPGGHLIATLPNEKSFSLAARQLVGRVLRVPRDSYTLRELLDSIRTNTPPQPEKWHPLSHTGYDYERDTSKLASLMRLEARQWLPVPMIGSFNPTLLLKFRRAE